MKIDLISWDRYGAIYSWHGLQVYGTMVSSDTFMWQFPKLKTNKVFGSKINWSQILHKYEIPIHGGEDYIKYFSGTAKDELEKELRALLKEELNQRALIEMILDGVIEFADEIK